MGEVPMKGQEKIFKQERKQTKPRVHSRRSCKSKYEGDLEKLLSTAQLVIIPVGLRSGKCLFILLHFKTNKNNFNISSARHLWRLVYNSKFQLLILINSSYFGLSFCFTTKCSFRTLKNYKNRHYCTWRSRGKEDGKQHQAFSVLYWSWQVPSALRFSSSFQTATFRSHQSGFKDVFWDGNVIQQHCMTENENKNKLAGNITSCQKMYF